MASRLSVDPTKLLDTLKQTVFKNASNEELLALVAVSNEYQLNPLLKEIYAFPAKGGGIVPVVSVDGWNKMLIRQPDFDGLEFEFAETNEGELISCTARVFLKNRSRPTVITEFYSECKRNTEPWNNMPRRMLRNRTLCQAARIACGFSGIYDDDEAASVIDVAATVTEPSKTIAASKEEKALSPKSELEGIVLAAGFTFDDFRKWGSDTQNIPDADSIASFAEVPAEIAKRVIRAKIGLLNGLNAIKK